MSLAEGVQARIAYKKYSTGVMQSNSQPVSSVDPTASAGQVLRRVGSSLKLAIDSYQSAEIRTDRQIADFRHGTKRVTGSITGEISPGTYWDFIEASMRGTEEAAITAGPTDFTSVAADHTTSAFTLGGGNPVTKGFRTGMVVRFTGLSDADNNSKNFVILGFSNSNNRTVTVSPAPDTMTADTSFAMVSVGKRVFVPATGHVSRKFAIEEYHGDIDRARLFTECRAAGFTFTLPASGMSTCEFPFMGRDMELYESTNAPFFTSPTDVGTTGILAAVNGLLQVNGSTLGVVTGLSIKMDLSPSSDAVVGQDFVPEVFLGRANVTGQVTAMLEDFDLINNFIDEDEVSILAYLTSSNVSAADAMTILLPRVKFSDADVALQGEGAQTLTIPFQALKSSTSSVGIEATTIQICDTAGV